MNTMMISGNSGIRAASTGAPAKVTTAATAAANAIPRPSTRPLATISKGAEMMKQLDQLKASDPEKLNQIVEDVKKATDQSTNTGTKAAEVASRPTTVQAATAQGKSRAGAAGGGADKADRGAMAIDVKQVVEDVKKAATSIHA